MARTKAMERFSNKGYHINESLFVLDPLTPNAWEPARDAFVARVETLDTAKG